ncbi:hypothetical protein RZS08_44245, partial [Arthrospira platensis SPKY1]|nr:hypothetical protein [Arthrospira platensis SPKY1]
QLRCRLAVLRQHQQRDAPGLARQDGRVRRREFDASVIGIPAGDEAFQTAVRRPFVAHGQLDLRAVTRALDLRAFQHEPGLHVADRNVDDHADATADGEAHAAVHHGRVQALDH